MASESEVPEPSSELELRLDLPLPESIWAGEPTPMFVCGTVRSQREVAAIEVCLGGTPNPCDFRERRRDAGPVRFWAALPGVPAAPGYLPVELRARFSDGTCVEIEAGRVEVEAEPIAVKAPREASRGLIAVCLASFDPDPDLLRAQIDSLRAQTDTNWVCVISDDGSRRERRAEIKALVSGDPRFVLSASKRRRGFYLNFERALRLAPREAEFIALCDQDDVWYPDKLETLREAIVNAPLAYSDARLIDSSGTALSHSLWPDQRPNTRSLPSVLVANSVAGASALIRADVARRALPFPQVPGWPFHDRWLPAVALAAGPIAGVERPLYDYVQHEGAVLRGLFGADADRRQLRADSTQSLAARWRGRFFYGYLPLRMYARALLARDAVSREADRRALSRLAEETPTTALRLSLRSLRPLLGRDETRGLEWVAASGLLWRLLAGQCRWLSRRTGVCETSPSSLNLADLAPPRWG